MIKIGMYARDIYTSSKITSSYCFSRGHRKSVIAHPTKKKHPKRKRKKRSKFNYYRIER